MKIIEQKFTVRIKNGNSFLIKDEFKPNSVEDAKLALETLKDLGRVSYEPMDLRDSIELRMAKKNGKEVEESFRLEERGAFMYYIFTYKF